MATVLISTDKLTKQYGDVRAVDDLSIKVSKGEVIGFVGANGAGKTTTISMLLGLISSTSGSVSVFDQPITPANAHVSHQDMGYAAGDMAMFETMTGRGYLEFIMAQKKGDHLKRLKELEAVFEPQLDKKIKTLSRGNKQKIALVAAFVTSPRLVILDEPTSGLDPVMQEAFITLIHEEHQRGTTIFMSSHYLQEVADACTRVLLMKNGKITHDLTAEDLKKQGGREVSLTTKKALKFMPKNISHLHTVDDKDFVKTTFSYGGATPELIGWLARQRDVMDVEITSQGVEMAFLDLYKDEETQ